MGGADLEPPPMSDVMHEFPSDSQAPFAARRAIGTSDAIPSSRLEDVMLLVSELVTNAVTYAPEPAGRVTLRIVRDDDRIRIEVQGGGTIPMAPALASRRQGGVGGFGLRLVDLLADRWGATANPRTLIWFEMHLD
jgi:anti-sigma regulatory factor (Ser/Thr protein kinase)